MGAYLCALRGMAGLRVPRARVRLRPDGTCRVDDGHALARRLRDRWASWSRTRRILTTLVSIVTAVLALAEQLGWLAGILRHL